jgi:hypothetical protein
VERDEFLGKKKKKKKKMVCDSVMERRGREDEWREDEVLGKKKKRKKKL